MLPISKNARPMRFSSWDQMEGPLAYGRFIRFSDNCGCSAEFLTPGEAKDSGSTTLVTCSPSVSYDAGIKTVRIWMPNFLFWLLTLGIRIFPELSVTFI